MRTTITIRTKIVAGILGVICLFIIMGNAWFVLKSSLTGLRNSETKAPSPAGAMSAEDEFWKTEVELNDEKNQILRLKEAVLGDAESTRKLEVYRQTVSDETEYEDSTKYFSNLTRKTQRITFNGTAVYTVDLAQVDDSCINVDVDRKSVTILIPHVEEDFGIDVEKTEAGETIHEGILSFGDVKLTQEESQKIIRQARQEMEAELEEDKVIETADKVARVEVQELYQQIVSGIDPEYIVVINFMD